MSAENFISLMRSVSRPSVLELGTRRSQAGRSTMHQDWVPHAADFLGSDFQAGLDVDLVADVCELSTVAGTERFDAIISCSTFEHIQYPWLAAVEICRALKTGGLLFVQTHQTFPIHSYPSDYWRFTKEGLATLFARQVGFELIDAGHDFRARVLSPRLPVLITQPAFLNSTILVRKVSHPGDDFQWRLRP